jgi:hypothetical protein
MSYKQWNKLHKFDVLSVHVSSIETVLTRMMIMMMMMIVMITM